MVRTSSDCRQKLKPIVSHSANFILDRPQKAQSGELTIGKKTAELFQRPVRFPLGLLW
jgi:hypothetical protein